MVDLSILMPVFNERATARRAIDQVLATSFPVDDVELVIVDDGSTDGTGSVLEQLAGEPRVRLLRHDRNRGKGAALRTALEHASGTYAAIMDADQEYEPSAIGELLEPLIQGKAVAVFGTRGFQAHSAYSFWYVVGNKAVTVFANLLFNSWVSDIMTGQKALRTDVFRSLDLREQGFGIEPEITARLLQRSVRIHEVPVSYTARSRAEGKKLTALDGLRVVRTLLRCRLSPTRREG
jgi:glycosyltransferase involved in cell wall biosynthesis